LYPGIVSKQEGKTHLSTAENMKLGDLYRSQARNGKPDDIMK